jgi:hypothetical protein
MSETFYYTGKAFDAVYPPFNPGFANQVQQTLYGNVTAVITLYGPPNDTFDTFYSPGAFSFTLSWDGVTLSSSSSSGARGVIDLNFSGTSVADWYLNISSGPLDILSQNYAGDYHGDYVSIYQPNTYGDLAGEGATGYPGVWTTIPPPPPSNPLYPPVISGTVAGQSVSAPATISPFAGVAITDPNANQTETTTIVPSAMTNGTLSNLGGFSYYASLGGYADTGTAAAVTASIEGLIFTPAAVAPGQTVTTTFTIIDTDTAGQATVDSNTSVIAIAAIGLAASDIDEGLSVTLDDAHVGDQDQEWASVTNSASPPAEALDASVATETGDAFGVGSFPAAGAAGLAPGATDDNDILIGLTTDSAGAKTGAVTLAFTSDGTGIP